MNELREQLEAAYKGESEEETPETPEAEASETETAAEARARDEKGRFKAKADPESVETEIAPPSEDVTAQTADTEIPEEAKPLSPPNGWSAEAKAKWHELPEEVQQAALKREEDIHKQASKSDEERNFGREMYRTVQPYMAQIQAEGGTPASAVKELLNTAYLLRTASPQQKGQLLMQIARQYGAELPQPGNGQAPAVDPQFQALVNRINQLEGTFNSRQQEEQYRLQTEIQTELQAFAADPKHPHFEEVKAHMAALLREGAAKDLQDAYEQATWARPDIRATLLATQRAEEEQKRKAEAKRKADEAKRKAASITGGPGQSQSAPESRGLRAELEANFAAASGGV